MVQLSGQPEGVGGVSLGPDWVPPNALFEKRANSEPLGTATGAAQPAHHNPQPPLWARPKAPWGALSELSFEKRRGAHRVYPTPGTPIKAGILETHFGPPKRCACRTLVSDVPEMPKKLLFCNTPCFEIFCIFPPNQNGIFLSGALRIKILLTFRCMAFFLWCTYLLGGDWVRKGLKPGYTEASMLTFN